MVPWASAAVSDHVFATFLAWSSDFMGIYRGAMQLIGGSETDKGPHTGFNSTKISHLEPLT